MSAYCEDQTSAAHNHLRPLQVLELTCGRETKDRETERSGSDTHMLVENSSMHNITLLSNPTLELERVTAEQMAALHLVFLQKC